LNYPHINTYFTLQGEGKYVGNPSVFLRLAGCNVGCVWCDIKESWPAENFPLKSTQELVKEVNQYETNMVVITGGEPAMYDLTELCSALKEHGKIIHIETSGAYELKGNFDWITLSPKKFKAPVPSILSRTDELKVIVFNSSDFEWAEKYAEMLQPNTELYLQAEWDKKEEMFPLILDYIEKNPQWKLSVQTHKYLGIE
jgi:organic radical activating enzyme|tara:strand:+ start:1276 stop:1872 length:597 start_codon:yes stop_codon:yes gene_type:complete